MAITDAFTGTNGTGIEAYSSNWAYMAGTGTNFQIQSNSLAMATVTLEGGARRTETGFPNDQYAQGVCAAETNDEPFIGVSVRNQAAGSGDYYGFYARGDQSQLFEYDGTTWSQEGSTGAGWNAGQVLRLEVSGTTLTPMVGGATQNPPGAQTDATYSSGAPGVCGFNDGSPGTQNRLDDFECSDVAGGGGGNTVRFTTALDGVSHGYGQRLH